MNVFHVNIAQVCYIPDNNDYENHPDVYKIIEVGLSGVRAADNIQISYDFDRDGYAIKQAAIFSWDADDEECDPDWQEVAFIPAWGREVDAGE